MPPDGDGITALVDVEVEVEVEVDTMTEVEVDVVVEMMTGVEVDVDVGLGVGVGVGALDDGGAPPLPPLGWGHPQAPKSGWHPILGAQKSTESPQ